MATLAGRGGKKHGLLRRNRRKKSDLNDIDASQFADRQMEIDERRLDREKEREEHQKQREEREKEREHAMEIERLRRSNDGENIQNRIIESESTMKTFLFYFYFSRFTF